MCSAINWISIIESSFNTVSLKPLRHNRYSKSAKEKQVMLRHFVTEGKATTTKQKPHGLTIHYEKALGDSW